MPRTARIVVPQMPHHVVQRGNNQQDVFFVKDDRRVYLEILGEQAARFGLTVLGYGLMTNHIHLIVVPEDEESLARGVGRTHFAYTQYINRFHGRSGHLWQNRFYSCGLDESHLWQAMCYVERNPVRAKMVRMPWRYKWSSAAAHVGETGPPEWLDMSWWSAEWTAKRWRKAIIRPEDNALVTRLRLNTHTGRPLGSDSFLSRLEKRLGRRVRPLPVGRPSKQRKKKARRRARNR